MTRASVPHGIKAWLARFIALDEESADRQRAFADYARERTVVYARAMTILILSAALLWWPIDVWLHAGEPAMIAILSWWRLWIALVSLTTIALLTWAGWARRRAFVVVTISAMAHGATLAAGLSPLGEGGQAWFHSGYLVPLVSGAFLMRLSLRIIATLLITFTWIATSLTLHAHGDQASIGTELGVMMA